MVQRSPGQIWEILLAEVGERTGAPKARTTRDARLEDIAANRGLWREIVMVTVARAQEGASGRLYVLSDAEISQLTGPQRTLWQLALGIARMLKQAEDRIDRPIRVPAAARSAERRSKRPRRLLDDSLAARVVAFEFGVPTPPPEPNATVAKVLFATDRAARPHQRLKTVFSGERGGKLTYGECDVSVPLDRLMGEIPRPSIFRLEFRPVEGRHVLIRSLRVHGAPEFFDAVRSRAAASEGNEAFVFVHGFNMSFEAAVLRTAQLALDLKIEGAPILYSWPSRGDPKQYLVDEGAIQATTTRFKGFLEALASRSGVKHINVLAHSMGNRAVCEALHLLSERGGDQSETKLGHVALAAPDVDTDVFVNLATAISRVARSVTLYASSKDKALMASQAARRAPRAGQPIVICAGIDSVDASSVDTDFLQHGYFAKARSMLAELFEVFGGLPAPARFNLRQSSTAEGIYYVFKA